MTVEGESRRHLEEGNVLIEQLWEVDHLEGNVKDVTLMYLEITRAPVEFHGKGKASPLYLLDINKQKLPALSAKQSVTCL